VRPVQERPIFATFFVEKIKLTETNK